MSVEVSTRLYGNIAGLSLVVYDCILTWDREVQHIWRSSQYWIKFSFFIARYLAFAVQIVNVVHSTPAVLQYMNGYCLPWFQLQVASIILLLGNMELILMVRVYALYERNKIIGICLLTWYLLCRAQNLYTFIVVPPNMRATTFCVTQKTPEEARTFGSLGFGAIIIFNQSLCWALTYWKYRHSKRLGWIIPPVAKLVMRDHSWVFLVLSGLVLSLLPYSFHIRQIGQTISCLMTCVLSLLSCRVILNTRSLATVEDGIHDPVLSSALASIEVEAQSPRG